MGISVSSNVLNYQSILDSFAENLRLSNSSKKTIQNYISDVTHFLHFIQSHNGTNHPHTGRVMDFDTLVSVSVIHGYIQKQAQLSVPGPTINRRLSSLRSFIRWSYAEGHISHDTSTHFQNLKPLSHSQHIPADDLESIFSAWVSDLQASGASKVTIKNYLTDIRKFIAWIEANSYNSRI